MSNILSLISDIKLNTHKKKREAYFLRKRDCTAILDILWDAKLIWGYQKKDIMIKIYFKYYLNKSVITSIKLFRSKITLKKLTLIIRENPQSLFVIRTNKGYKTGNECLKQNLSGVLIFRIN